MCYETGLNEVSHLTIASLSLKTRKQSKTANYEVANILRDQISFYRCSNFHFLTPLVIIRVEPANTPMLQHSNNLDLAKPNPINKMGYHNLCPFDKNCSLSLVIFMWLTDENFALNLFPNGTKASCFYLYNMTLMFTKVTMTLTTNSQAYEYKRQCSLKPANFTDTC